MRSQDFMDKLCRKAVERVGGVSRFAEDGEAKMRLGIISEGYNRDLILIYLDEGGSEGIFETAEGRTSSMKVNLEREEHQLETTIQCKILCFDILDVQSCLLRRQSRCRATDSLRNRRPRCQTLVHDDSMSHKALLP